MPSPPAIVDLDVIAPLIVVVDVRIVANDVDVDNDPMMIALAESPGHDQIVDGADVPVADFVGESSFGYQLSDGLDVSRSRWSRSGSRRSPIRRRSRC